MDGNAAKHSGPFLGYWHVRTEDIHKGSATDANPSFSSRDVVMRRDYDDLWQDVFVLREFIAETLTNDEKWRSQAREVLERTVGR